MACDIARERKQIIQFYQRIQLYAITNHTCLTYSSLVRTKRVREARDEAMSEIDSYKAQKAEEFKLYENQVGRIGHTNTTSNI